MSVSCKSQTCILFVNYFYSFILLCITITHITGSICGTIINKDDLGILVFLV